jgi:PIN domain nuclease of toxin-antitoxin system
VRLLLDTHILLWTIAESRRLSADARALIGDASSEISFSVISLWEVAIKTGRGRDDFRIDVGSLRRQLLDNRFAELVVTGAHAVALAALPQLHKDPFDRMLVAPGMVEGVTLVTGDRAVARYPGPIRLV